VWARRRTPRTAEALAVVAFGLAAITAGAAAGLGVIPARWTAADRPYWLLVTVILMTAGVLLGRRLGLEAWTWLGWLTAPFVLATVLGLGLGRIANEDVAMTGAALAFLALAAVLFWAGSPPQLLSAALALVPTAIITVVQLSDRPPAGAILIIAAVLLLLVLQDGEWTEWIGWPLFGVWLALLASLLPWSVTAAVVLAGGVLLFLLGRRNPVLGMLTAASLWSAWLLLRPDDVVLLLAGIAVALYAFALRREAAPVAWFGAVTGQAALLAQWTDPPFLEASLLVFAVLLLLAGGLQWRAGERRTAVVLAPGVAVGLIPSALLTWDDIWSTPALVRFLSVLVVGGVLLLIGVRRHLLGLVIPSAIAVGIAALAQVFATLDLLPRWLALALVGGVLIIAGARLEWLRARRRETQEWLESLS
jgi:hypothetical protein